MIVLIFIIALTMQSASLSVAASQTKGQNPANSKTKGLSSDVIDQKCSNCKLVSQSIEHLLGRPRTMDSYGKMSDRFDLDKTKKTVCRDIVSDASRQSCREFYFSNQETVKKWKDSNSKMSFFDFVCIKELKYCCPRNSFGPKCNKCIECGLNEHCHGDGYRSGTGKCVCKEGHSGIGCANCQPGYFMEKNYTTTDSLSGLKNNKVLCKPCHRSCVYCRNDGPKGCDVCREGFTWVPTYGCLDIDECVKDKKICGPNTFCVNTEGSYYCYECDRACDGCHGDGPDMCLKCAKGYKLGQDGNCEAKSKTVLSPEANYYRYAIYLGLFICTSIILHNNVQLAALVGMAVAMYVGASEYVMNGPIQELNPLNFL